MAEGCPQECKLGLWPVVHEAVESQYIQPVLDKIEAANAAGELFLRNGLEPGEEGVHLKDMYTNEEALAYDLRMRREMTGAFYAKLTRETRDCSEGCALAKFCIDRTVFEELVNNQ